MRCFCHNFGISRLRFHVWLLIVKVSPFRFVVDNSDDRGKQSTTQYSQNFYTFSLNNILFFCIFGNNSSSSVYYFPGLASEDSSFKSTPKVDTLKIALF